MELETLLIEDCCQTQEVVSESLGDTQAAASKRSKAAEYIQMQGNLQSYEFNTGDFKRRFCMTEMLHERYKKIRLASICD